MMENSKLLNLGKKGTTTMQHPPFVVYIVIGIEIKGFINHSYQITHSRSRAIFSGYLYLCLN